MSITVKGAEKSAPFLKGGSIVVSVVVPAAGQGKRMHAGINKTFLTLLGTPMLVRTMQKLSACSKVDEIIVAVGEDEVEGTRKLLEHVPNIKPFAIVAGGAERQDSVANGLRAVSFEADIVLVHDAARPMVSVETIEKVIDAAKETGAAIAAVPAKNTIKVVDEDGIVESTPERASLWEVQTPQGFKKDMLMEAYQNAYAEKFLGTDDASLVERLGYPVKVVMSDYRNIKITTPEDLLTAEAFLGSDALDSAKKGLDEAKKGIDEAVSFVAEKAEEFRKKWKDGTL